MIEMRTVYQIINVSKTLGKNDIIPDFFVHETKDEALKSVLERLKFFEENKEIAEYKGEISSIAEIHKILTECDFSKINKIDCYIYKLEVV